MFRSPHNLEELQPAIIVDFLRYELERRKLNNSSYSLRAFSRDIGLSHSDLSKALNGKKCLSVRTVARITERITMQPLMKRTLIAAAALSHMDTP